MKHLAKLIEGCIFFSVALILTQVGIRSKLAPGVGGAAVLKLAREAKKAVRSGKKWAGYLSCILARPSIAATHGPNSR